MIFGLFQSVEKKTRANAATWLELADKIYDYRRDVLSESDRNAIQQAAGKTDADGMLAAEADDQLAGSSRGSRSGSNLCDSGCRIVRQFQRGQRVHAVFRRRLTIKLAIVQFNLL